MWQLQDGSVIPYYKSIVIKFLVNYTYLKKQHRKEGKSLPLSLILLRLATVRFSPKPFRIRSKSIFFQTDTIPFRLDSGFPETDSNFFLHRTVTEMVVPISKIKYTSVDLSEHFTS